MNLDDQITTIKGIGDQTAQKLAKLDLHTVLDLVRFIPRRYLDYTNPQLISQIKPKQTVSFKATLGFPKTFFTKTGKLITEVVAEDQTGQIKLVWFNNPYLKKIIKPGSSYTVAGLSSLFANRLCLISPTIEEGNGFSLNTQGLVPVYPQTAGLKSPFLRKKIFETLNCIEITDPLTKLDLSPNYLELSKAYYQIHFPQDKNQKKHADKRLSFNEHLKISLHNLLELQNRGESPKLKTNPQIYQKGLEKFPFELTPKQITTSQKILQDLSKNYFTHRLVQGDTGSGKTATIILAANQSMASGFSCFILAPTQILANQHFLTFQKYSLYPDNLQLVTAKSNNPITDKPTIFIGTHSLLNLAPKLKNTISFIAIDEQHKFGVDQRDYFQKQNNPPHLINLSATPIPRTVAQGLLGEISISTITTKPQNRLPIKTNIINQKYFNQKGLPWLIKNIRQGTKAFVVAPNIFENENSASTETLYQKYRNLLPHDIDVFVLHGQIKPEEQNQIIAKFIDSNKAVLVATPLIEVGLDIKNADIIIIHSAERFGLAQLHQLRGRVGRGDSQGYCLLIPTQEDQEETERLKLLTKYHSGLVLAKKDLQLRGAGEIFGKKQHGTFQTRLQYFWSKKSYLLAKKTAQKLINEDQTLAQTIATKLDSC